MIYFTSWFMGTSSQIELWKSNSCLYSRINYDTLLQIRLSQLPFIEWFIHFQLWSCNFRWYIIVCFMHMPLQIEEWNSNFHVYYSVTYAHDIIGKMRKLHMSFLSLRDLNTLHYRLSYETSTFADTTACTWSMKCQLSFVLSYDLCTCR